MYFLWVCEDIIGSVRETIERWGVGTFKDFAIYFLGALVVKLLISGYGFFNLFFGIVSRDFASFVFGIFCDCG